MELDYYKILESLKGVPNLAISYTKKILSSCYYMKENLRSNEADQNLFEEGTVRPPGKQNNVALIRPMSYKLQIFTNELLECVFDKYMIT